MSKYGGDDNPDDEEYSNQRRRRRIHDYREMVSDTRLNIADSSQIGAEERQRVMFEVVKSLAMEIETLLTTEDNGAERDYWNEIEIGEIVLTPPRECVDYYDSHMSHLVQGTERPMPVEHTITGLESFIGLETPVSHTWTLSIVKGSGYETKAWRNARHVPIQVSEGAYRACNHFLSDVGMDMDVKKGRDTGWDYEDMFPGRGEEENDEE